MSVARKRHYGHDQDQDQRDRDDDDTVFAVFGPRKISI